MDDQPTATAHARRPSGRDAKRASRAARAASSIPYITRRIPYFEALLETTSVGGNAPEVHLLTYHLLQP